MNFAPLFFSFRGIKISEQESKKVRVPFCQPSTPFEFHALFEWPLKLKALIKGVKKFPDLCFRVSKVWSESFCRTAMLTMARAVLTLEASRQWRLQDLSASRIFSIHRFDSSFSAWIKVLVIIKAVKVAFFVKTPTSIVFNILDISKPFKYVIQSVNFYWTSLWSYFGGFYSSFNADSLMVWTHSLSHEKFCNLAVIS